MKKYMITLFLDRTPYAAFEIFSHSLTGVENFMHYHYPDVSYEAEEKE